MKTKIERIDGIVYERKQKVLNYDKNFCIRVNQIDIDNLKKIAELKGIKTNTLAREVLEKFIKKEIKNI